MLSMPNWLKGDGWKSPQMSAAVLLPLVFQRPARLVPLLSKCPWKWVNRVRSVQSEVRPGPNQTIRTFLISMRNGWKSTYRVCLPPGKIHLPRPRPTPSRVFLAGNRLAGICQMQSILPSSWVFRCHRENGSNQPSSGTKYLCVRMAVNGSTSRPRPLPPPLRLNRNAAKRLSVTLKRVEKQNLIIVTKEKQAKCQLWWHWNVISQERKACLLRGL